MPIGELRVGGQLNVHKSGIFGHRNTVDYSCWVSIGQVNAEGALIEVNCVGCGLNNQVGDMIKLLDCRIVYHCSA